MTGEGNRLLIIVPCLNEEGAVGGVLREVRQHWPGVPVLVIDDGSVDATISVARNEHADVLSMPVHLGLGGSVQAGYRLAFELGYDYVIRIDGDGQHDPRDIGRVYEELRQSGCEMVIGSRFVEGDEMAEPALRTGWVRGIGIRLFRALLRPILGRPVRDPTSGFVGVNRAALAVFSRSFPLEYPEIEALVVLQRRAFRFSEVRVGMRARQAGHSTITPMRSIYYLLHVLLGVFVNILKFGSKKDRHPRDA